jgi:superfamily I DNA and/or RNA helicase
MHPEISDIPNRLIYEGRLVDKVTTLPALPHEELGARPLVLYDTSVVNPWSSRPPTGSRYNLYSAVVAMILAERAVRGAASIGISRLIDLKYGLSSY